jgi:hypothetical protein
MGPQFILFARKETCIGNGWKKGRAISGYGMGSGIIRCTDHGAWHSQSEFVDGIIARVVIAFWQSCGFDAGRQGLGRFGVVIALGL